MWNRCFILAACALALSACGDDHDSTERPTCDLIGETCHDSTTDEGQECHEFGEDAASTEDQCADREEECLALCE